MVLVLELLLLRDVRDLVRDLARDLAVFSHTIGFMSLCGPGVGVGVLIARVGDVVTASLEKEILTLKVGVSDGEIVNVEKDELSTDVGAAILLVKRTLDNIIVVGLGIIVVVGTGESMSRSSIRELTRPAME